MGQYSQKRWNLQPEWTSFATLLAKPARPTLSGEPYA